MLNEDMLKTLRFAINIALEHTISTYNQARLIAAQQLITEFINGDIITSTWTIDDVKSLQSNEDEFTEEERITDDEARAALKLADDNHDATTGINWDVLQECVDMVREGNNV